MDATVDPHDSIINRINLQLARSRSILNSWRPEEQQHYDEQDDGLADNDADFAPSRENGGIGAKIAADDESALPTRRSAQKDKLLEQLIGKKAANAKRKEDAHKSMSASRYTAPKPAANGMKQVRREEESDDEEEGRAAAFKSKKSKRADAPPAPTERSPDVDDEERDTSHQHLTGSVRQQAEPARKVKEVAHEPQQRKRKGGGSYLDELLSKKARKKCKKKDKM